MTALTDPLARESGALQQLAEMAGWEYLERWLTGQVDELRSQIERGASSWDDYNRAVGALGAFRAVLDRPGDLAQLVDAMIRGDNDE